MTTWDPSNIGPNIALSSGNLTATLTTGVAAYSSGRGTTSKTSGKYYYEITVTILTAATQGGAGTANASAGLSTYVGADTNGLADFQSSGVVYNGGASGTPTFLANGKPAVIGVALDLTNKLAWFKVVGGDSSQTITGWNQTSTGGSNNPATGVGGQAWSSSSAMFPAFTLGSANSTAVLNTGATAYTGTIPSGFSSWDPNSTTVALSATSFTQAKATDSASANLLIQASGAAKSFAKAAVSSSLALTSASRATTRASAAAAGSIALHAASKAAARASAGAGVVLSLTGRSIAAARANIASVIEVSLLGGVARAAARARSAIGLTLGLSARSKAQASASGSTVPPIRFYFAVETLMRDAPVAALGFMGGVAVPAVGTMSNQLAVETLMRNTDVALLGLMGNIAVPAQGEF